MQWESSEVGQAPGAGSIRTWHCFSMNLSVLPSAGCQLHVGFLHENKISAHSNVSYLIINFQTQKESVLFHNHWSKVLKFVLIGSSLNQSMWPGTYQIPIGLGLNYLNQCLGQEMGIFSLAQFMLPEMGWTQSHHHRQGGVEQMSKEITTISTSEGS